MNAANWSLFILKMRGKLLTRLPRCATHHKLGIQSMNVGRSPNRDVIRANRIA
jgi:hypothetical protein